MLRADAAGFSVSCMIGRFPRPTWFRVSRVRGEILI